MRLLTSKRGQYFLALCFFIVPLSQVSAFGGDDKNFRLPANSFATFSAFSTQGLNTALERECGFSLLCKVIKRKEMQSNIGFMHYNTPFVAGFRFNLNANNIPNPMALILTSEKSKYLTALSDGDLYFSSDGAISDTVGEKLRLRGITHSVMLNEKIHYCQRIATYIKCWQASSFD